MRYWALPAAIACLMVAASARGVSAQVFRFERTLAVGATPTVNIFTNRGGVSVRSGEPGRVVVNGTVRVRMDVPVPADAEARAQAAAGHPPVEQTGDILQLRTPADPLTASAVTIGYEVSVPPEAIVSVRTDTGALLVDGIQGRVTVRTESGAVTLAGLGETDVTSGSGGITIRGINGHLTVTTTSGGLTAAGLRDGLDARTKNGHIDVVFDGPGDVDVRTETSPITLGSVEGALIARSDSGRVRVSGTPVRDWTITTESSQIDVTLDADASATLLATTADGAVTTPDGLVTGEIEEHRVSGTIRGGGKTVRLESRIGSITVR